MRNIKIIQIISLVLGLILFFYLIYSVGIHQLFSSIKLVGVGFIFLILVSAVRHLFRTAAWFYSIEKEHRQITFFELFNIRMAGEAVRLLSFTGPLLGEPSKAILIRKRLPIVNGMSSIIIENLTYTIGGIFVISSGLFLLIANYKIQKNVKLASLILCLCMFLVMLGVTYLISRRIKIFTFIIQAFTRRTNIQWFKEKEPIASNTEEKIHDFYKHQKSAFFGVFFLQLSAHIINIFEIYLILYFIQMNATLMNAYIIEAVMKVVNILFFFVPGQIGVTEGGNALLLKVLGMGISAGVTLSLIEKIRTIFWVGYGLIIWMTTFHKNSKQASENNAFVINEFSPKETS